MESRLSNVFNLICKNKSNEHYKVDEIALLFNVSNKTISNDISLLNEFLQKKQCLLIVIDKNIALFDTYLDQSFIEILDQPKDILTFDKDARKKQLLLDVILNRTEFTIQNLIIRYNLSKNTVVGEIKKIRQVLEEHTILLEPTIFKGYELIGEEVSIRKLAMSYREDLKLNIFEDSRFEKDIILIENLLRKVFQELSLRVSQYYFDQIVYEFFISSRRYENRTFITKEYVNFTNFKYADTIKSFSAFQGLFPNINQHSSDLLYLTNKISEASLLEEGCSTGDDWLFINVVTMNFVRGVANLSGEPFFLNDEFLYKGILTHLKPAIQRLRNEENLENPLFREVIENHRLLYANVCKAIPLLEYRLNIEFTEQETSFLSLFFMASLQRKETQMDKRIRAIIVCNYGLSTSEILSSQLQGLFNVSILGTFAVHEADEWLEKNQVDFIFSTLLDDLPLKYPIIKVNPILSQSDIGKIYKYIKVPEKGFTIDSILTIVKNHVVLSKSQATKIYKDLQFHLSPDRIADQLGGNLMLLDMLNENYVEVKYPAKDYEDAVKKCGELLVRNGAASDEYIEAMLENVKTNGTYIVIAPGIAMPHARPEKGALKTGFSIMTLEKPINFGHPTNDPVRLVIGLCATDHESHLRALSELVEFLSNEQNVDALHEAISKNEMMEIIKKGVQK